MALVTILDRLSHAGSFQGLALAIGVAVDAEVKAGEIGRRSPASRSPRTRGDGPGGFMAMLHPREVLPAHAGMALDADDVSRHRKLDQRRHQK